MKILKEQFPKKEIGNLPRAVFEGPIHVIISEREANAAVRFLKQHKVIGFDTETKPTFNKGKMRKVALLQLSTHDTCFLFRLNRIDLPDSIVELMENPDITKVGLSLNDDTMALNRRRKVNCQGLIDLQKEVKQFGVKDLSLQKIYANFLGGKIAKTQQLSNWEADALSESQQRYAATDAWSCIMLLEEMQRLLQTGDYTLEAAPVEPTPSAEQTETTPQQ